MDIPTYMHTYTNLANTISKLVTIAQENPQLVYPKYRGTHPLQGFCYIICEVISHMYPQYRPHYVKMHNGTHWYLANYTNGRILDPTVSQYYYPEVIIVPYEQGKACGYLTSAMSKRAQYMYDRL